MARALATYISLPGTTAEAMHHWHEIFGGELNIMTYDDVPMEGMPFEPHPGAVAHATLDFPGGSIAGSDVLNSSMAAAQKPCHLNRHPGVAGMVRSLTSSASCGHFPAMKTHRVHS